MHLAGFDLRFAMLQVFETEGSLFEPGVTLDMHPAACWIAGSSGPPIGLGR